MSISTYERSVEQSMSINSVCDRKVMAVCMLLNKLTMNDVRGLKHSADENLIRKSTFDCISFSVPLQHRNADALCLKIVSRHNRSADTTVTALHH